MSLESARLASVSKELHRLDARIGGLILHVRFLSASVDNFEERLLVETVNKLKVDVMNLASTSQGVLAQLQTAKRSGAGRSADAGRFRSAVGLQRHVQGNLADLAAELGRLGDVASARLNDPGRYGDASFAAGPFFELLALLQNIGDAVAKAMRRQ